jgi:hypothetical protein
MATLADLGDRLTEPSVIPTPPRAWQCPPSTGTCCGVMVAGPVAATSTSSSSCRGWTRCWRPPGTRASWIGAFGGWPRREHWHAPIGDRRTKTQRTYNRCQAGLRALVEQSIDPPCQRLVAAPLARPAPSDSARLPGRRRARLPGPVATPDTHLTKHRGHSQNRPVSAAAHLSSAWRSASVKASRSALSTSSVPTTMPVPGSTTGTMASDSVLAKAVR